MAAPLPKKLRVLYRDDNIGKLISEDAVNMLDGFISLQKVSRKKLPSNIMSKTSIPCTFSWYANVSKFQMDPERPGEYKTLMTEMRSHKGALLAYMVFAVTSQESWKCKGIIVSANENEAIMKLLLGNPSSNSSRSRRGEKQNAKVHPSLLRTLSQSHPWVFGAIAELLHNSIEAECQNIYVTLGKLGETQKEFFMVADDGNGMSHNGLDKMLYLGKKLHSSQNPVREVGPHVLLLGPRVLLPGPHVLLLGPRVLLLLLLLPFLFSHSSFFFLSFFFFFLLLTFIYSVLRHLLLLLDIPSFIHSILSQILYFLSQFFSPHSDGQY